MNTEAQVAAAIIIGILSLVVLVFIGTLAEKTATAQCLKQEQSRTATEAAMLCGVLR